MYLKTIKIDGFKSFAEKTEIMFDQGITSIVGPNGSGKSNVVDAVRWVLGEQSVKSLRGDGGMTDVIFSGSKSRRNSSSASVTLIFDNTDGYLPIEYTEVSIKRILYKTGDGEYFLNGERCRLKDITDLLIDTGASKESFNIISQGDISQILSGKPEDRRIIFEEVAGVLKYKKRKEDANRKLDRTTLNMVRITDIIDEVAIQVEPLKEQAKKAREYLTAKEKLGSVEIALIVNDVEKINFDYSEAKKAVDELNDMTLNLTVQIDKENANAEKSKLSLAKLNEELFNLQQTLLVLTKQSEKLSGEKALILERQKYNLEDETINSNLLELKETLFQLENKLSNFNYNLEQMKKEQSVLKETKETIESDVTKNKEIYNDCLNKINQNVRKQNELRYKISSINNNLENNNFLPGSVKSIINSPKLEGIHGVVSSVIETKEEYGRAIDVAFGASVNNIIVENEKSAKDAIWYLKENSLGRATFLPMTVIKGRVVNNDILEIAKKEVNFINVASNMVTFDKKYNEIINNLLGSVLVVKTLDTANKLGKEINYRSKIVTLDGEIINVGGSVTGGVVKNNISLISEKYELLSCQKELKIAESESGILDQKIADCLEELKLLEESNYKVSKNISENNEQLLLMLENIHNLQGKIDTTNNEIKGLTGIQNNSLDKQTDDIVEKYYETVKNEQITKSKIEDLVNDISLLSEKIDHDEKAIKYQNSELNRKINSLKEKEIKISRYEVLLDNYLQNLTEEYNITYEKAKETYELELPEEEARSLVSNLKSKVRSLGVVNIGAAEEYERVGTRYEFLIKQREDLERAKESLLEIIDEMDIIMTERFLETFELIQVQFRKVFKNLFGGGDAQIKLIDKDNVLTSGIDIIALPPGKKLQHLSLLSGGEKTLTAISLLFASILVKPVPFCILDEIEAALDEVNVNTFGSFLKELKERTQFILITHKKKTMEYADTLYGITMQESGVSKLVSVKLEDKGV